MAASGAPEGGGGTEKEGEKTVCQPKWKTRGAQDFVLAHILKPFCGVLIDCGMLAVPAEVKTRIVWPRCIEGGGGVL